MILLNLAVQFGPLVRTGPHKVVRTGPFRKGWVPGGLGSARATERLVDDGLARVAPQAVGEAALAADLITA